MVSKRIAMAAAFVCAASMLSIGSAEARDRMYVSPLYHGGYIADTSGLPWYAVRAHYNGGPWTYGYDSWATYAARNG